MNLQIDVILGQLNYPTKDQQYYFFKITTDIKLSYLLQLRKLPFLE